MTPEAKPRLSVVMPVYNEARTLREIVGKAIGPSDAAAALLAMLRYRFLDRCPERGPGP